MSKLALNMLTVCQKVAFELWGGKVWAFYPRYVLSNLGKLAGRERRVRAGGG